MIEFISKPLVAAALGLTVGITAGWFGRGKMQKRAEAAAAGGAENIRKAS